MRNIIEPVQAATLPAEILRRMPEVTKAHLLRITYEIVDENGFTEEQAAELRQAIEESKDSSNLVGPFSPEEAISYLNSLDKE